MPRTCSICTHPDREAIDSALVAGEPFRNMAERFGTSTTTLHRHKQSHIPGALVKATEAREVARADSLLDQVRDLQGRALGILTEAETGGDHRGLTVDALVDRADRMLQSWPALTRGSAAMSRILVGNLWLGH